SFICIMQTNIFTYSFPFALESGEELAGIDIAYSTYGHYVPKKSKVVWVCHALTANAAVFDWWQGLFGEKDLFNPMEYFIVCANVLGSCYGSTQALSLNPITHRPYFHTFPFLTIRDMVNAHILLRKYLQIEKIEVLVGGSLGGQQALEWSVIEKQVIQNQILIATNALHSPWGIAFNEAQRMCITADVTWQENYAEAGLQGMKAARAVALLSYRNEATYQHFQAEEGEKLQGFRAAAYQQYQGEKLAKRFHAFSYMTLSRAMDSHNIARGRGGYPAAVLQTICANTLVIGINSDILFPLQEQQFLAQFIPYASFQSIDSIYGHDGFLLETQTLSRLIGHFLSQKKETTRTLFSIH
ncbi:MAG: homoserine O-acetyltransferase, partial [Bacteroidia bacterium]